MCEKVKETFVSMIYAEIYSKALYILVWIVKVEIVRSSEFLYFYEFMLVLTKWC